MWSSSANAFSSEQPLEDLEETKEYNFTQPDSQGFSQSLSQGLSQYSFSQVDSATNRASSAGPVCTECQGTDFSTTDMGDMFCALCGTAYAGNINESQEVSMENLQGMRRRRVRKDFQGTGGKRRIFSSTRNCMRAFQLVLLENIKAFCSAAELSEAGTAEVKRLSSDVWFSYLRRLTMPPAFGDGGIKIRDDFRMRFGRHKEGRDGQQGGRTTDTEGEWEELPPGEKAGVVDAEDPGGDGGGGGDCVHGGFSTTGIAAHARSVNRVRKKAGCTVPPVCMTLIPAILYLCGRWLRAPLVPLDMVRWISDGSLPYMDAFRQLPLEVRESLGTSRWFFIPKRMPHARHVAVLADRLAALLGIRLPPVNTPALALRFAEGLGMPPPVLDAVTRLARFGAGAELYPRKELPGEARATRTKARAARESARGAPGVVKYETESSGTSGADGGRGDDGKRGRIAEPPGLESESDSETDSEPGPGSEGTRRASGCRSDMEPRRERESVLDRGSESRSGSSVDEGVEWKPLSSRSKRLRSGEATVEPEVRSDFLESGFVNLKVDPMLERHEQSGPRAADGGESGDPVDEVRLREFLTNASAVHVMALVVAAVRGCPGWDTWSFTRPALLPPVGEGPRGSRDSGEPGGDSAGGTGFGPLFAPTHPGEFHLLLRGRLPEYLRFVEKMCGAGLEAGGKGNWLKNGDALGSYLEEFAQQIERKGQARNTDRSMKPQLLGSVRAAQIVAGAPASVHPATEVAPSARKHEPVARHGEPSSLQDAERIATLKRDLEEAGGVSETGRGSGGAAARKSSRGSAEEQYDWKGDERWEPVTVYDPSDPIGRFHPRYEALVEACAYYLEVHPLVLHEKVEELDRILIDSELRGRRKRMREAGKPRKVELGDLFPKDAYYRNRTLAVDDEDERFPAIPRFSHVGGTSHEARFMNRPTIHPRTRLMQRLQRGLVEWEKGVSPSHPPPLKSTPGGAFVVVGGDTLRPAPPPCSAEDKAWNPSYGDEDMLQVLDRWSALRDPFVDGSNDGEAGADDGPKSKDDPFQQFVFE